MMCHILLDLLIPILRNYLYYIFFFLFRIFKIYKGTPRGLFFNLDYSKMGKKDINIPTPTIEFHLFLHEQLLRCAHLLSAFTFYDERNGSESICGICTYF
jgi:hypothetical protein